ncbi:MAG: amidohydrolase family protein [Luteitalea sp.]|nr:amidohydrolase family protein [Luteitalea sp.]
MIGRTQHARGILTAALDAVTLVAATAILIAAAERPHPAATRGERNHQADSQRGLTLSDYDPVSMLEVASDVVTKAKVPAVDFHNHINHDEPERLLHVMDACNVAVIVNFTGGFGETLQAQVAKFARHADRFLVFANVNWDGIDEPDFGQQAARQLEADVKAGARGLKIFKNLGLGVKDNTGTLVAIDDRRLDPVWAKAGELDIPVAIHTSDPDAFFLPVDRFNERYEELQAHPDWSFHGAQFPSKATLLEQRNNVIARHPRTTFVALHVANHAENLSEVAAWLDRYPNLYVEIGARLNELGRQPYTARTFFVTYADRILFGVDSRPAESVYHPYFRFLETFDEHFDYFTHPRQGRWKIYGIGLPDEVLEKVYRRNARKLLRLD